MSKGKKAHFERERYKKFLKMNQDRLAERRHARYGKMISLENIRQGKGIKRAASMKVENIRDIKQREKAKDSFMNKMKRIFKRKENVQSARRSTQ